MSKANASCNTMCWASAASARMRALISSTATATGIICFAMGKALVLVVMALLCQHESPLQCFQPGICLESAGQGGFQ